jgi:histone-lysine N-methyltransferase SETMAR
MDLAMSAQQRVLEDAEPNHFEGIVTGDESWFQYTYEFAAMYARSRSEVTPRTRVQFGGPKTMITVFFSGTRLIVLNALPKGARFNQEYFLDWVLPKLYTEKRRYTRSKLPCNFWVHMDNSMCHNGGKIVAEFEAKHLNRMPHPPYSPDLSPCDFWFFGMVKEFLKGKAFTSSFDIQTALAKVWNDLTFEEVARVFQEWRRRLEWVIENGGEYYHE